MNDKELDAVALSIRLLTIDAIQKANSGHPGLPLGCAEVGALLFGAIMSHYPQDPNWVNRDRFVLSAGHGSMLLYSLLHLCGYDLSLDDIRNFRQLGSKTTGHPELGQTPGVETTTGPLGQGFANAVGLAIAERMLAARFNTTKYSIINHYTYVLASDGDLMEGVCGEAASLAGHLGLGKLIVFYDSNGITIDGATRLSFSENVLKRFEAFNWQTLACNAYDMDRILNLVKEAQNEGAKPTLILLDSIIGKGSASMAGCRQVHGAPLGEEEIRKTKRNLGVPEDDNFHVEPEARRYFQERQLFWKGEYETWENTFSCWKKENPERFQLWQQYFGSAKRGLKQKPYIDFQIGQRIATRAANGRVLSKLAKRIPNLVGGSADLLIPNFIEVKNFDPFTARTPEGRWLYYGVREHAMGAIANGISLHGGLRTFCATFLVFSDYMRPAIRLAALMKQPVIFVFTHDSILSGEDGPTHQPIEHIASLRLIPNLLVLRPGDAQETEIAWRMCLQHISGPTALILTRQAVEVYQKQDNNWRETIKKGAYIMKECEGTPQLVIVATGSEVKLALDAANLATNKRIRVVSMLSRELFLRQEQAFQELILPKDGNRMVVEAGVASGWERIFVDRPAILSLETFGVSAPGDVAAQALGMDIKAVMEMIRSILGK